MESKGGDWALVTFGQMEAGMARYHQIADDKRTQFQARLRKFQRMGIPEKLSKQVGGASFSLSQALEVAMVLELTEFGMAPERAIARLKSSDWEANLGYGWAAKGQLLSNAAVLRRFGYDLHMVDEEVSHEDVLLALDPNNLAQLMQSEGTFENWVIWEATDVGPGSEIAKRLAGHKRMGFINLSRLLDAAVDCFLPAHRRRLAEARLPLFLHAYRESQLRAIERARRAARQFSPVKAEIGDGFSDMAKGWRHPSIADLPQSPHQAFFGQLEGSVGPTADLNSIRYTPDVAKGLRYDAEARQATFDLPHSQRIVVDLSFLDGGASALIDKMRRVRLDADKVAGVEVFPFIYMTPDAMTRLTDKTIGEVNAALKDADVGVLSPGGTSLFLRRLSRQVAAHQKFLQAFSLTDEQLRELHNGDG